MAGSGQKRQVNGAKRYVRSTSDRCQIWCAAATTDWIRTPAGGLDRGERLLLDGSRWDGSQVGSARWILAPSSKSPHPNRRDLVTPVSSSDLPPMSHQVSLLSDALLPRVFVFSRASVFSARTSSFVHARGFLDLFAINVSAPQLLANQQRILEQETTDYSDSRFGINGAWRNSRGAIWRLGQFSTNDDARDESASTPIAIFDGRTQNGVRGGAATITCYA